MKVGDLVRETETDPTWILYNGTLGLILRSADKDMGLHKCPDHVQPYHWLVSWGCGSVHIMNIDDIEVIDETN